MTMAPVCLLLAAIERLICPTPNLLASACNRWCRTISCLLPLPTLTSTSRKMARSPTPAPSAFRAASLATKQAAYRRAGFLPRLQYLISSRLNMPSSPTHSPRASSCSTRQFSIRSIPRPTITTSPLRVRRYASSNRAEVRRGTETLELLALLKEEERNRRERKHDEDELRTESFRVTCEGPAKGITSQTSMKPDEWQSLAALSSA